jgi:CheY-like chemotaxis protein
MARDGVLTAPYMGLGTALGRHGDGATASREAKTERLGGARADFAANLGRRAAEIGALLSALEADPKAPRPRDDLRRRIHALGAGAKLLRFRKLSIELRTVEDRLDAAAKRAELLPEDLTSLRGIVANMADLAWGQGEEPRSTVSLDAHAGKIEANDLRAHREATLTDSGPTAPLTALVVGSDALAKTLQLADLDEPEGEATYEVERTYDAPNAIDLARALAPDVIVVDAELPAARELIEALTQDPLTEHVPIVVVGRFARPEDAGPYLAYGVAKTLPKPVSPTALRSACKVALSAYTRRESKRDPLGDLRIDELGSRLAEELRRGLCDAAEGKGRSVAIDMGEGTEVLAALWGAVARIRDLVTIKSGGNVRFSAGGPEGALPFAAWQMEGREHATQRDGAAPRGSAEGSLEKCSILVADDDPSITWFLAGVFRAAGATVFEARDGARALEIAKHKTPDLVVSDVLMPHMDGFSLCRELKRDVVLRDLPVVLLSWKEDLLQRVRELGADADGYLRKEASAGVIVQRVRELVRRRRRVRERIAAGGEVRGRLDGLSAATLLRFVCELRPSSTLALRDATFLYEIEIRRGRPARATRTAVDGTFQRGSMVLASLLGAGDGRFVITPAVEIVGAVPRGELEGDLAEQLLPLVAAARGAQRLVSGENLVKVERLSLDDECLASYLAATPEPSRALLRSLARGASPRAMMVEGRVAPHLLESILVDASAHGAVVEVIDAHGEDMLPIAIDRELALLRGERSLAPIPEPLLPEPAEPSAMPPAATPLPAFVAAALGQAGVPRASQPPPAPSVAKAAPLPSRTERAVAPEIEIVVDEPHPIAAIPPAPISSGPPSGMRLAGSIAAAMLPPPPSVPRDLGALTRDPSPAAPMAKGEPSPHDSIAAAIASHTAAPSAVAGNGPTANDAPKREAFAPKSPLPARASTSAPAAPPGLRPMMTLGSLTPPPVMPAPKETPKEPPKNTKSPKPAPVSTTPETTKVSSKSRSHSESPEPPSYDRRRFPLPSMFAPTTAPAAPKKHTTLWIACAVAGIVFAVWARSARQAPIPEPVPPQSPTAQADAAPQSAPPAGDVAKPEPAGPAPVGKGDAKTEEGSVEDLPLRKSDELKKGQGLLEVVTGKSDSVYIDGKAMGSGPTVSVPLKAREEPYELKVKLRNEERVRSVAVKEGRITRVRLAPPWQR